MGATNVGAISTPPATAPSYRRLVVVALSYVLIVVVAAVLPLLFRPNPFFKPTAELQAYKLALWLAWLPVVLESMRSQPSGPLWKLTLAYALAAQVWAFAYLPGSGVYSVANVLGFMYIAISIHLILAFPSGRLEHRADRALVGFYYVFIGTASLALALVSQLPMSESCGSRCYQNLFAMWPNADLASFIEVADVVIPVLAAPLVLVRLWRHWRNGSWFTRQALLPLLIAVPIVITAASLDLLSERLAVEPINSFFRSGLQPIPQFVLPIAFFVGLLRLRLSRGRIADLILELGRGVPAGGLRDVLARTLGDPGLELAFASPSGNGFVDFAGREVDLPADGSGRAVTRLERDGELLGVLIHDPRIDEHDEGLVQAAGTPPRLALENERLTAQVRAQLEEVRASRARIVDAGDAERRRIERDLHDGAQQRLLALAMRLQTAKETTAESAALLEDATSELQTAIREVRNLARGLHPPILTESGLGAAVDELAERTPVSVSVRPPPTRYREPVESAAYFVVAEALTNVVRHADARHADVTMTEAEGQLWITIHDDGRGGADPGGGSGLVGLRDRVSAIGGSLMVTSPAGGGTTVTAALPIR